MENLLRPWLLARFILGVTACVLSIVTTVFALRATSDLEGDARVSTRALRAERRAELISAGFSLLQFTAFLDLLLGVVGADRMVGSLRGAMCAYGVLHSTEWGMRSLELSFVAVLATSAWAALHRIDLSQAKSSLVPLKLRAAIFLTPLLLASFFAATKHAMSLDFHVVASCCSTGIDGVQRTVDGDAGGPHDLAAMVSLGLSLVSIAAALFLWRSPGVRTQSLFLLSSGLALVAFVPALVWFVAPFVYETPAHMCPFCLLHADALGVGYVLLFGWLFASTSTIGVLMARLFRRRVEELAPLDVFVRGLAKHAALAWAFTITVAAIPVIRYLMLYGRSVFG